MIKEDLMRFIEKKKRGSYEGVLKSSTVMG